MSDCISQYSRRSVLAFGGTTAASLLCRNTPALAQQIVPGNRTLSLPVLSQPNRVVVHAGDVESEALVLSRSGESWQPQQPSGPVVTISPSADTSEIFLESPAVGVQRIQFRWKTNLPADTRVLGDAWERSYGDLEWMPLQPDRVLPWYTLATTKAQTVGVGVKAGAAALAFWQVDQDGISLWLDVRNGGNGVRLGRRRVRLAILVSYSGQTGESAYRATKNLCRQMTRGIVVPSIRGGMPTGSILGSNDWYYAYGKNTPDGIIRDADLIASITPPNGPRAFTVIDDGYQDPAQFPDLRALATRIRKRGVRPGIWVRPLKAGATANPNLLLPVSRWQGTGFEPPPLAFDPTIDEGMEKISAVLTQARGWGYDLIKHDFTTFELFGQWGSQMGPSPTRPAWHFSDRSLTNAEIVTKLYKQIRTACGEDILILGCNTVGHLSVGLFDASRTGDDVSGKSWERTRRTGVNTLAYRLAQHGTFFSIDADCVPLTHDLPWSLSKQWLEALAASGTVLMVSPEPGAVGSAEKRALREAFLQNLKGGSLEPLDWLESRTPSSYRDTRGVVKFNWVPEEGANPFPIGIQRSPE